MTLKHRPSRAIAPRARTAITAPTSRGSSPSPFAIISDATQTNTPYSACPIRAPAGTTRSSSGTVEAAARPSAKGSSAPITSAAKPKELSYALQDAPM
ncbi:hypothetical protein ACFW5W_26275 [Streptomyces sp. NPDC058783]|uniref:hypothetical protein n=1 Tax=Streptomyces sp. NPDC058783 TaxID=3346633 RepID=UPI00367CB09E